MYSRHSLGFFGEFSVEPNRASAGVAASPPGLHLPWTLTCMMGAHLAIMPCTTAMI
jgi:hypothetical protein